MKNDSTIGGVRISVPPTLLVSAIGRIDDVRQALTLDLQEPGDVVFLVGTTRDETGGSEYFRWLGEREGVVVPFGDPRPYVGNKVPRVRFEETLPLYRALRSAIADRLVRSAATPARGGWALAFARAAMAGELGLDLDVSECEDLMELPRDVALFSESAGRFLITTAREDAARFEQRIGTLPCRRVGRVTREARIHVRSGGERWLDVEVARLKAAYKETLADE